MNKITKELTLKLQKDKILNFDEFKRKDDVIVYALGSCSGQTPKVTETILGNFIQEDKPYVAGFDASVTMELEFDLDSEDGIVGAVNWVKIKGVEDIELEVLDTQSETTEKFPLNEYIQDINALVLCALREQKDDLLEEQILAQGGVELLNQPN